MSSAIRNWRTPVRRPTWRVLDSGTLRSLSDVVELKWLPGKVACRFFKIIISFHKSGNYAISSRKLSGFPLPSARRNWFEGKSIMSEGWLTLLILLPCVVAYPFIIWISIKVTRRKVMRWNSNSTIWFVMSMGNFGAKQIEMWRREGYDEYQARTIIKNQMWCVIGLFSAFCVSVSAVMGYEILTH